MFKQMYDTYLKAKQNRVGKTPKFFFELSSLKRNDEGWFRLVTKKHLNEFLDEYDLWKELDFDEGVRYTMYSEYMQKNGIGLTQTFCLKFV